MCVAWEVGRDYSGVGVGEWERGRMMWVREVLGSCVLDGLEVDALRPRWRAGCGYYRVGRRVGLLWTRDGLVEGDGR